MKVYSDFSNGNIYAEGELEQHVLYVLLDVPGGWLMVRDGNYYFTANDGTVITKECY